MLDIRFEPAKTKKAKPDESHLGFGKYFTDHMFVMDYKDGQWYDPRIVPNEPFLMDPATMVLHYAQESFEGLKAYKSADGKVLLFRPDMNAKRLNVTHDRLCMPQIPVEDFVQAVCALVKYEKEWIPEAEGTSLYIRPFTFATDVAVGVHPSKTYRFMIILSPVGAYYPEGLSPVKIFVEDEYVRAVIGGTGHVKTGGNYASSIKAQDKAEKMGYTQVLWLDGVHRKYVEEVGTMNVFFKVGEEILTAPLGGSILPGITRDSCITLLKEWGYQVSERQFSIDELMQAAANGELLEAFGSGTAAVVSPIGELNYAGKITVINHFEIGSLTQKLYNYLTGIQWGSKEDQYNWIIEVK